MAAGGIGLELAAGDCPPVQTYHAEQTGSSFGANVAGGGDLNADGLDDVIISAAGYDLVAGWSTDWGMVFAYQGATRALLHSWFGEQPQGVLGTAIDHAGDVDGDGHADVVIGAGVFSDWHGFQSGKAYLYSGATGRLLWTFHGESDNHQLGWAVAGAGDVDLDGFDDVIVGAAGFQSSSYQFPGRAYVLSGRTGEVIWWWEGESAADQFGREVDGAGDINGDGHADLIVGAWWADSRFGIFSGKAYLFCGATGRLIRTHAGEGLGFHLGSSVAGVGDVNRDGFDDYAVGASHHYEPRIPTVGKIWMHDGRTGDVLLSRNGDPSGEYFGHAMSRAGDLNRDGVPDVIVGSYNYDFLRGRAVVLSGDDGRLLQQMVGEQYFDLLGFSVSDASDVNGDGYGDVIIGATDGPGPAGPNAGTAYVYLGHADADLDCDGRVGVSDLQVLLRSWSQGDVAADLNGDGAVNGFDLAMLLASWG